MAPLHVTDDAGDHHDPAVDVEIGEICFSGIIDLGGHGARIDDSQFGYEASVSKVEKAETKAVGAASDHHHVEVTGAIRDQWFS